MWLLHVCQDELIAPRRRPLVVCSHCRISPLSVVTHQELRAASSAARMLKTRQCSNVWTALSCLYDTIWYATTSRLRELPRTRSAMGFQCALGRVYARFATKDSYFVGTAPDTSSRLWCGATVASGGWGAKVLWQYTRSRNAGKVLADVHI